MRVLQALEQVELVENHLLVAPDILLQDDLDGHPAVGALSLPDDAISAGAERAAKPVPGSNSRALASRWKTDVENTILLVIAVRLPVEAVEHVGDFTQHKHVSGGLLTGSGRLEPVERRSNGAAAVKGQPEAQPEARDQPLDGSGLTAHCPELSGRLQQRNNV